MSDDYLVRAAQEKDRLVLAIFAVGALAVLALVVGVAW